MIAAPIAVELTELRKLSGILSKKITLGDDGKPKSDGSGCRLTFGMARRNRMNGGDPAGALAGYLNGMDSKTALALGRMTDAVDDECRVVSKKRLRRLRRRHPDHHPNARQLRLLRAGRAGR